MFRLRCLACGEIYNSGTDHKCKPVTNKALPVTNSVTNIPDKALPVTNRVASEANKAKAQKVLDGLTRQQRFRAKNRDRYNAKQREHMAKRRAALKTV